jgi:hypothetical protein
VLTTDLCLLTTDLCVLRGEMFGPGRVQTPLRF